MAAKQCWQTETRAMQLQKDAEKVQETLAGFTRSSAHDVADTLSVDECLALSRQRLIRPMQEFSVVWNELPSMPPHPTTFFELHANREPS